MNELLYLFANKSTYNVCIDISNGIIRLESSNCYIRYVKRKSVMTLNKNTGQCISITRIYFKFLFRNELVQKHQPSRNYKSIT